MLGFRQKVIIFSAAFTPNSNQEEEIWEAGTVTTTKRVDDSFPSDVVARITATICLRLP